MLLNMHTLCILKNVLLFNMCTLIIYYKKKNKFHYKKEEEEEKGLFVP